MVKSGFWGHISHLLGVCLYAEVVLDFRFGHFSGTGSAQTESEDKVILVNPIALSDVSPLHPITHVILVNFATPNFLFRNCIVYLD